ncbi:MAG: inositol monophosphatase [bacterium]|nr:inositol monophosphatase [bacterium]
MFEEYGFSVAVRAAAKVAELVGSKLCAGEWSREVTLKEHQTFENSSVTESDKQAQKFIMEQLALIFPEALFLAEEKIENPTSVEEILKAPLAFCVDPIDGTTEFAHDLFQWCVSIGVLERGLHIGGVIYAPKVCGGLMVVGEQGLSVYLAEHGREKLERVNAFSLGVSAKPVVSLGLDVQRSNAYRGFIAALPKELRPRHLAPSGAFELGLVAAGRIDALVQSPQMPWDWAAGYSLVIESEGKFQCYCVENGKIIPLEGPNDESYRRDKQTLGFIAGKPEIVDKLFPILVETYGK